MATERFLYRTTPKGKIHFSWGVSHSWGSTTIRVGNGCNILGLDVETEGWKDGIVKMIETQRAAGGRCKFVFDGFLHAEEGQFLEFIDQFGCPDFALFCTAAYETIKDRWCKKNEAEGVPEDAEAELAADSEKNSQRRDNM